MEEQQQAFDLNLLEEIRTSIEYVAPDMSDYLMLSELARVTKLTHHRLYYGIKYGKKRPLYGIKRGDRWFVHRLDALQWAADSLNDQADRALKHARRIGRIIDREKLEKMRRENPPQRMTRVRYDVAPAGLRTYTYMQAATAVQTSVQTMGVYLTKGNQLGDVPRYITDDGRVVMPADPIDAFAATQSEKRKASAHRKFPTPTAEEAERDRAEGVGRGRRKHLTAVERGAA